MAALKLSTPARSLVGRAGSRRAGSDARRKADVSTGNNSHNRQTYKIRMSQGGKIFGFFPGGFRARYVQKQRNLAAGPAPASSSRFSVAACSRRAPETFVTSISQPVPEPRSFSYFFKIFGGVLGPATPQNGRIWPRDRHHLLRHVFLCPYALGEPRRPIFLRRDAQFWLCVADILVLSVFMLSELFPTLRWCTNWGIVSKT